MIRQGDVMLVRVEKMPANKTAIPAENGRVVLARGEATGHHHSIALSGRVALFREDGAGSGLFLSVSAGPPVALVHQEHTALVVPEGEYRVVRQRVWDAGAARRVAD